MRRTLTPLFAALALWSGGCATASAPVPAQTLVDAINLDSIVVVAIDTYATSPKPDPAVLRQARVYADAAFAALQSLEASQAAGTPLDFAAFNAAMATLQSYNASKGI